MLPRKLLTIALICTAPAVADTVPGSAPEKGSDEIRAAAHFLSLYRNHLDCENLGYIQTGEADEHFAPIFLSNDTDRSKRLSLTELQSNSSPIDRDLIGVGFAKMDRDKDGWATADELRIYLNNAVTLIDSNADGDVYPAEYEYAMKTGTVLKAEMASSISKKQKSLDFVPPWVRHDKAINRIKSSKDVQTADSSKVPAKDNP